MDNFIFKRMNKEINFQLRNELRDKILDNMNLDDVPNMSIIFEYLNECNIEYLLELSKIAEILDWQLVGRIIGVIGETYKDKEC